MKLYHSAKLTILIRILIFTLLQFLGIHHIFLSLIHIYVFCLTAHAGCGKTFTQTAIIHKLNSLNLSCIATAFSLSLIHIQMCIRDRCISYHWTQKISSLQPGYVQNDYLIISRPDYHTTEQEQPSLGKTPVKCFFTPFF